MNKENIPKISYSIAGIAIVIIIFLIGSAYGEEKGKNNQIKREKKQDPSPKEKRGKPFLFKRYRGPVVELLNFTEATMGSTRSSQLLFYGMKWTGFNTMFEGETFTDANLIFSFNAPKYYAEATGQGTSGWVINMNFLFETTSMQGRHHMAFYGFGPMFKYSHFNASLFNSANSTTKNYVLDDMALGIVLNVGLAFEIGRYALRSDLKYYIESKQYFSFGLSFQFDF